MNDPIKDAFTQRAADAADIIDVESGLAGVHRRNSLAARAAHAGAAGFVLLLIVGVGWSLRDGDDVSNVENPTATTTPEPEPPSSAASPSTTTPSTTPDSVIPPTSVEFDPTQADLLTTSGLATVGGTDGRYLPGRSDPIIDAFDDRNGGVVFQTDWGIFHRAAGSASARFLTEGQLLDVGGQLNEEVLYTRNRGEFEEQVLYRRRLDTDDERELAIVGGIEWSTNEASFTDDGIFVFGGDGFCTGMRLLDHDGDDLDAGDSLPYGGMSCNEFSSTPTEGQLLGADMGTDGTLAYIDDTDVGPELVVRSRGGETRGGIRLTSGPLSVDVLNGQVILTDGGGNTFTWFETDLFSDLLVPLGDGVSGVTTARFIRTPLRLTAGDGPTHTVVDPGLVDEVFVATAPGDNLNLRIGPGVHYPADGSLAHESGPYNPTGEAVRLPTGDIWARITAPAVVGWVNISFLTAEVAPGGTAACLPTPGQPSTTISTITADIDQDGTADTASVVQIDGTTQYEVRVAFANGGVAEGPMANYQPWTTGANDLRAVNLHHIPDGTLELIIGVGQGAAGVDFAVYTLDGCAMVEPTISGETFGLSLVTRASAGLSATYECAYDTGGLVEVVTHEIDFNAAEHDATPWHLDGTIWTDLGTSTSAFDPADGSPTLGGPTTCV